MEGGFSLSARTKDFTSYEWGWISVPAGSTNSAQRGPNTGKAVRAPLPPAVTSTPNPHLYHWTPTRSDTAVLTEAATNVDTMPTM